MLVVGGGPAGAAVSSVLARQGRHVTVLDRQRFPRDKVCGDALGPGSVELLQRLGMLARVLAAGAYRIDGIRFVSPDQTEAMPRNAECPGYVVRRQVLDATLLACAREHGAQVVEGARVVSLLREGARVVGVVVQAAEGSAEEWRASWVVGADGEHSVVRHGLGMGANETRHRAYAVRQYMTGVQSPVEHVMEILAEAPMLPGYAWIFPLPDGSFNVGCGLLGNRLLRSNTPLTAFFRDWAEKGPQRSRLAGAVAEGKPRGWPLSLGTRTMARGGDGWLLCGDAASLVDPLTGEGIHAALHSGELAAQAILAHGRDASRPYQAALDRVYGPHLRVAARLQTALGYPFVMNRIIASARRHADLGMDLLGMFGGVLPAGVLLKPAGLWRYLC